jgi:sensor histidine kinase YesM
MSFFKRQLLLRFTQQDTLILLLSMTPLTFILNLFIFGKRLFNEPVLLAGTACFTFFVLALYFLLLTYIAVLLRNRFPEESQNPFRLGLAIGLYSLISFLVLTFLFRTYDWLSLFHYRYNDSDFAKALVCLLVTNVFLTFLLEGVSRFELYQTTFQQTENLQKEYAKSQMLGLKSQIAPHFLFNSLNSLSSLIQDDPEEAETFLNEMSKVYRHLLRNTEEYLVTLDTELAFIKSYTYLLKARYGDAFQVHITVAPGLRQHLLPPLTLQIIIENIMAQNAISKREPLQIAISASPRSLTVTNSVFTKLNVGSDTDTGLENISAKYRLLSQKGLTIATSETERTIYLPLILQEEAAPV